MESRVEGSAGYKIVDEPKSTKFSRLIVNPLLVLFVSIIVPLFWMPPFFGKFWLPVLWLIANGYLMGSPTFLREVVIGLLGLFVLAGIYWSWIYYLAWYELPQSALSTSAPYVRILLQAALFLTLYLMVFMQAKPYAIRQYIKELSS